MSNGKKLVRNPDNRMIAGVASGIADYFDIDVTLVRVILVVTAIFGGAGLVVYIVMWILVPEGPSSQAADGPASTDIESADSPEEE